MLNQLSAFGKIKVFIQRVALIKNTFFTLSDIIWSDIIWPLEAFSPKVMSPKFFVRPNLFFDHELFLPLRIK
jgi:hypothetical protein